MYTVKTTGTTKYVVYPWINVKWGWTQGIYFVNPEYEKEFIAYIKANELLEPACDG